MIYKATYTKTDLSLPLTALVKARDGETAASIFEEMMETWSWYTIDPATPDDAEPGTYLMWKGDRRLCTAWNLDALKSEIKEAME